MSVSFAVCGATPQVFCFQHVLLSYFIGKKRFSGNGLVIQARYYICILVWMCHWVSECEFYNSNSAGKEILNSRIR